MVMYVFVLIDILCGNKNGKRLTSDIVINKRQVKYRNFLISILPFLH